MDWNNMNIWITGYNMDINIQQSLVWPKFYKLRDCINLLLYNVMTVSFCCSFGFLFTSVSMSSSLMLRPAPPPSGSTSSSGRGTGYRPPRKSEKKNEQQTPRKPLYAPDGVSQTSLSHKGTTESNITWQVGKNRHLGEKKNETSQ